MKLGFWVAPEGSDAALSVVPLGGGDASGARRTSGVVSFLATSSGEQLIARCPRAAALLPQLARALQNQDAAAPGRLFDITDYARDDLELITQVLGEGEVSGLAALPGGVVAQIAEASVAGLWRVRFMDASGRVGADYLEVGA